MHLLHSGIVDPSIVQVQHRRILRSTNDARCTADAAETKGKTMTMMTDTHAGATPSKGVFARLVETVTERMTRYAAYRRTMSELSMLTDRELRDFGANRSMIRSMAYEQAYRSM